MQMHEQGIRIYTKKKICQGESKRGDDTISIEIEFFFLVSGLKTGSLITTIRAYENKYQTDIYLFGIFSRLVNDLQMV